MRKDKERAWNTYTHAVSLTYSYIRKQGRGGKG